jgi:Carbamoyl-phosphate synthase small chain, CPSase domain
MSGRAFGRRDRSVARWFSTPPWPAYRGQILVLTYRLVGSYGVPAPRAPGSLDGPYESGRVQVQGLP